MSPPLILALPGNERLAAGLAKASGGQFGMMESRRFPDGETYLRLGTDVAGLSVVLVSSMDHPDPKIPALLFAAQTVRLQGAARVGLIAPYLCYMRQDRMFQPGEAVTSRIFANLISRDFDWMATIDPHLHRIHDLTQLFTIPARALHAGQHLAAWIKAHVASPFLIGPDEESAQWVEAVAATSGARFAVLRKTRLSDREVKVVAGDLTPRPDETPVVVDDVISTGRTILAALEAVKPHFRQAPLVVAVHAILVEEAARAIAAAGARLVSSNTVSSPAAEIDIAPLLAEAVRDLA